MSPKFKFRFASVLRHREILEKQEAKEFAIFLRKCDTERQALKKLENKYDATQSELGEKKVAGADMKEIKMYYTFLTSLKNDMVAQQKNVAKAEEELEEQRQKLIKSQMDKKVIEKLKKNDYLSFVEEDRKEDIRVIDEINTGKAARKEKQ